MGGEDGRTNAGLRKWSERSSMHVRTLTKHRDEAIRLGWLHPEADVRERTRTVFRCCVPDHVVLSEKDEELRDQHIGSYGDLIGGESVASRMPQIGTSPSASVAPKVPQIDQATREAVPQMANEVAPRGTPRESVALGEKSVAFRPADQGPSVALAEKSVALGGPICGTRNGEEISNQSPASPKFLSDSERLSREESSKRSGLLAQPGVVGKGGNGESAETGESSAQMPGVPEAERKRLAAAMLAKVPDQPLKRIARDHDLSMKDMERLERMEMAFRFLQARPKTPGATIRKEYKLTENELQSVRERLREVKRRSVH
jgi:hypothetical protein